MNHSYCDLDFAEMEGILRTCFDISDFERIKQVYQKFKSNIDSSFVLPWETIERADFLVKTVDQNFQEDYLNPACIVWVDLPVLLESSVNNNGLRIMIVRLEPQRPFKMKHAIELNTETIGEEILLSPPFVRQLITYGKHSQATAFRQLSFALFDKGYSLYYTDIYKASVIEFGKKTRMPIPTDANERFMEALKMEIETIRPAAIVSFGSTSRFAINHLCATLPTQPISISFPNPMKADNTWKKLYGIDSFTPEDKVGAMVKKIESLF